MFKKVLSLSLIALILFSFVAGVSAQNNYISIYSRTQDNDGDGVIEFYNEDNKLFRSIQIKKGETKVYDLNNVEKVIFHSKGRNSYYDAKLNKLTNYWNDRNMDNININVDVNFYKKKLYYNRIWINHDVYYYNLWSNYNNYGDYIKQGYSKHGWIYIEYALVNTDGNAHDKKDYHFIV